MKLYHEFFGSEEYQNRRSEVWLLDEPRTDGGDWFVKFFEMILI